MSSRKTRSIPRVRRDGSRKSDNVGYGKPPSEHTWQAGQSGNPKGRPKGSKNKSTILREIFQRKIESRSERGTKKITILEGILLRITEDSSRATPRARRFFSIVTPRWFQANCNDRTSATTIVRCWKRLPNELRGTANNRSGT